MSTAPPIVGTILRNKSKYGSHNLAKNELMSPIMPSRGIGNHEKMQYTNIK